MICALPRQEPRHSATGERVGTLHFAALCNPRLTQPLPAPAEIAADAFPLPGVIAEPLDQIPGLMARCNVSYDTALDFLLGQAECDNPAPPDRAKICRCCLTAFNQFVRHMSVWKRRPRSLQEGVCARCMAKAQAGDAYARSFCPILDLCEGQVSNPNHHVEQYEAMLADYARLRGDLVATISGVISLRQGSSGVGACADPLALGAPVAEGDSKFIPSRIITEEKSKLSKLSQDWKADQSRTAKIECYGRDVRIKRFFLTPQAIEEMMTGGGKRGEVKLLSTASLRNMLFTFRNIEDQLSIFVTCTYPGDFPTDGLKVKRDLKVLQQWLRDYPDHWAALTRKHTREDWKEERHEITCANWGHRPEVRTRRLELLAKCDAKHQRRLDGVEARKPEPIGGAWFLEFQDRGAPHIHLALTAKFIPRELIQRAWYRIVGSGDPNHKGQGIDIAQMREKHAASAYAAKYAAKAKQKEVPEGYTNVGRFWATFGGVKAEAFHTVEAPVSQIAPAIRVAKKLNEIAREKIVSDNAQARRVNPRIKPVNMRKQRRDNGYFGKTMFNIAAGVASFLALTAHHYI